jgi:hypothetical protein
MAAMKNRGLALMFLVLLAASAVVVYFHHRGETYTLVTDREWPVGEARTCSLDGQYKEGHCFPPNSLSATKFKYLVGVQFDEPVHFDAQHWAGLNGEIVCRLDSYKDATCRVDTK